MKPWRITIDTNPDECNLKCTMCDTHSPFSTKKKIRKSMDSTLLENILDEVLKLQVKEIIPTTMGEALLYKHFSIFIDKIKGTSTKLNLTTNGTFLKKWQDRLLPILSDIKISINSINKVVNEKIMIGDQTEQKIQDIKNFIALRNEKFPNVSITLQVTFLKSNLDELENIIKFGIENGVNRIKGHHLWINFDEIKNESLLRDPKLWNQFIHRIEKYRKDINLVNFEKITSSNGSIPEEYICPFLGNELWIDFNGDYNICCAPSDKRVVLGSWGNFQTHSIENLFNSENYTKLINSYKEQDICRTCPLRKKKD